MFDVTVTVIVTTPPRATCAAFTVPAVAHPFEKACVVVGATVAVVVGAEVVVVVVVVVVAAVVVVASWVVVVVGAGCAATTVTRAASSFQWPRPFQPAPKTPTLTTCAVIGSFAGTVHVAVN